MARPRRDRSGRRGTRRPRLDESWAMAEALSRAFAQAGRTAGDIGLFDIYSCFPCAVTSACRAMDIDPLTETRPLTLTGGLPFFGGPGNNYSLHGIASMVDRLRAAPGTFGLVLANGGWMTKEAAGIYATARPEAFTPAAPAARPTGQVALAEAPATGVLETYTVLHGRNGPERGITACRTPDGRRFLALSAPEALPVLREEASQAGRPVAVTTQGETHMVTFK